MTVKSTILVVEDSRSVAATFRSHLEAAGYTVLLEEEGRSALSALQSAPIDCILLDLKLPDIDGLDVLRATRRLDPPPAVIVTTANASLTTAVEAVRLGAFDYLVKPVSPPRLMTTVSNALANVDLRREIDTFKRVSEQDGLCSLVGRSPVMQRVYRTIDAAARSNASVFITGESGTGKELAAEAVHRLSNRSAKPFIALNCAAIPKDLLESTLFGHVKGAFTGAVSDQEGAAARADGGTLFLDELGEMDIALQSKMLRFIQSGQFERVGDQRSRKTDIRFIAATNRDPVQAVRDNRLREDLFYRLYVVPLDMPPLRERGNDVILIANRFLRQFSAQEGRLFETISPDAEARLLGFGWPGNVRQLQNVIRNAIVLNEAPVLTGDMLSLLSQAGLSRTQPLPSPDPELGAELDVMAEAQIRPLAEVERDYIEAAIQACDGNVTTAAKRLAVSPSTIYRKRETWLRSGG